MTLNTYVAGDPASLRELSTALRDYAEAAHEGATGYHRTRSGSEAVWEGQAGEGYRSTATREAHGGDDLANVGHGYVAAVDGLAADLDTVQATMGHAQQAAHDGGLAVQGHVIYPPQPPAAPPGQQVEGILSDLLGPSPEEHAQQQAHAHYARQQAAYQEAQAIVHEARQLERAAHERLQDTLSAHGNDLRVMPQQAGWEHAAASATTPAAVALSGAADQMGGWASQATRTQFEKAAAAGPAAAAGMWRSLTTTQQSTLKSQYPQLVGNTDGVPVADRHQANMSVLGGQRAALVRELDEAKRSAARKGSRVTAGDYNAVEEIEGRIDQLDRISGELQQQDKYLVGMDSTANGRGQLIVASGNPDEADNVHTFVPGTGSDLSTGLENIHRNDAVIGRAHEIDPNQSMAGVTWIDYESPASVPAAIPKDFAYDAAPDLARFQEGLRVTHYSDVPSHNSVLGHSYGSTTVGLAQHNQGLSADEIGFVGSPGIDSRAVPHASDLHMPPDAVWSGTSESDPIDKIPSFDPVDQFRDGDINILGRDPSDPSFHGNVMPTDPTGQHSDYWSKPQSLDSIAKLALRGQDPK